MDDFFTRVFENIVGRIHGPMHLRIIFQPVMAIIFACISGWKDAKSGAPVYFWSMMRGKTTFREVIRSGWKGVGRVFLMAVVLDIIYQIIELQWVYPGETVIVAIILVAIPYLLLRGVANILFRKFI